MPMINESWKRLWNAQEIRILVLVNLCFQFGLVFWSPLRKHTGRKLLIFLLWFFYLFSDYVAILALGNLLRWHFEGASGCHSGVGLGAFWAPFLLLHLGGPDTITSFSIEDNELWWRHFLGLVVHVVVAFMVLLKLVVVRKLRVAAALVFIAGLVKYSERTWALRFSSMDQLRSSMLKPKSIDDAGIYPYIPSDGPLNSNILYAYGLFKGTIPLVADIRLTGHELRKNRVYFEDISACKAFQLVDIELSFLYDVFHTKAILINGPRGCLWRFVSLGMIFSAFVLFLKNEKRDYAKADITITYVLFGSALFMELISHLLIIFSDWMIVTLEKKDLRFIIAEVMSYFFPKSKPRWSNSMGQYRLLRFSLGDKNTIITWILGAVKVKRLWDKFIFTHSVPVPSELEKLLYEQLNDRFLPTLPMVSFQELKDSKGDNVLLQHEACHHLRWSINNKDFDESILLWHIATDHFYHNHGLFKLHGVPFNNCSDREISWIISNYMVYLLIMQPSMMPDGIGKIRFQDTCANVKKLFDAWRGLGRGLGETMARQAILHTYLIQTRTWSVLSDACRLAKQLDQLDQLSNDEIWHVISRVWVEMLAYAAINCKTYYHAKQLSQGGEFLTHFYLLMTHMCT